MTSPTAPTIFVAEITVYDPALPGTRVVRYASGRGFTTGALDTPAHTLIGGRLSQPAALQRSLFKSGTTFGESQIGQGDVILANNDGALDGWKNYGVDGRSIVLYAGVEGAVYPSGFTKFVATMQGMEVSRTAVTLSLRDRFLATDIALQPTKFAGTNVLPTGLEGGADLFGKPKPVCFGQVRNVAPPCVNTSKLIYQLADSQLASVDAVYDKGLSLVGTPIGATNAAVGAFLNTIRLRGIASGWKASPMDDALYRTRGTRVAACGSDGSGTFYIGTSTDEGATWGASLSLGGSYSTTEFNAIAFGNTIDSGPLNVPTFIVGGAAALASGGTNIVSFGIRAFGGALSAAAPVMPWNAPNAIRGIAYWPERAMWLFVADGGHIGTWDGQASTAMATSQTSGVVTDLLAVATCGTLAVIVGKGGVILTSPDGVTWTAQTNGFGANDIHGIAIGADRMVACGAGNQFAVSPLSGAGWVMATGPIAGATWRAVAYSQGLFSAVSDTVAAGFNLQYTAYTSDGVTIALAPSFGGGGGTTDLWAVTASVLTGRWFISGYDSALVVSGSAMTWASRAPTAYASLADLQDDTKQPVPGLYGAYLGAAGSYIRLGSTPAGQITCDATEGATSADRTTAQVWKRCLTKLGFTSSDYSASDVTALDGVATGVVGFWTADETTLRATLDAIAATPGAFWGPDRLGVYRIRQFAAPSGVPVLALTANDIKGQLERITNPDLGAGIPVTTSLLRYTPNYTPQTDLAGAVTADRKADLANADRSVSATDASVLTAHPLAPQADESSLFATQSDAQVEVTRRQALRGVLRDVFTCPVALSTTTSVVELGDVVQLTHARFGLSLGKLFRVTDLVVDAAGKLITFTLWG